MNNTSKTRRASVAGVVGLTAAGIAAMVVLANDPATDTPDSKTVQQHSADQSARIAKVNRQLERSAQHYTGPRTADAADAWLESKQPYTGPRTADAAEVWLESKTAYTGLTTTARAEPATDHSGYTLLCPITADTALHWIRATGHLPCEPR